jgi:hypothetical protein
MSSVASFLRSSDEAMATGSRRSRALYPEMLSPSDTKVLMDGVFRRSLGSLTKSEKGVDEGEDEGEDEDEDEEEEGEGEDKEVAVAAKRRSSSRSRGDRVRKSLRYDTMEVPASSPRRSLVGSSM